MELSFRFATLTIALAFLVSTTAFAKGGNDDGAHEDNVKLLRGSQAWFLAESSESAIGKLSITDNAAAEAITDINVTVDAGRTNTVVQIKTATQNFNYNCQMIDQSSKGGTIIKKEVVCQ